MLLNIKYEFSRIFKPLPNIIILVIFLIASVYSVYTGVSEYQEFKREKKLFLKYEKMKFGKYITYGQMGDGGFRLLFEPDTISLYFSSESVFDNLYSQIDMSEIIEINQIAKGKKIFSKRHAEKGFSNLLAVLASLIMIYMGATAYINENYFYSFGNILIRMIILNVSYIALMALLYIFPAIFGMPITNYKIFVHYCIYSMAFIDFFFAGGVFLNSLIKRRVFLIICTLAFWFVSIAVIPKMNSDLLDKESKSLPSNEKYNIMKLKEVIDFEGEVRKAVKGIESLKERNKIYKKMANHFLNNGYKKNIQVENEMSKNVTKVVDEFEGRSMIYPTTYYNYLCEEMSSKGYTGYLNFADTILKIRHDFVKFILEKRYESQDPFAPVENFLKNDGNIYKATAQLPKSFWKGFVITAIYPIILLLASYFILRRRLKKKKETFDPGLELAEGDMVYVLCKNDENENYQDKIYNHYEQQENTTCVDKIKGQDIDPGISLYQTARYFCKQMNARWDRTCEHIEKLGIKDLKKEKRSPEAVKKIYCAVCMAVEADTIVFKDFIKQESRKFERQFLALLKDTMDMDRTIIYLGTDPLLLDSPFTTQEGVDKFRKYEIDDPLKFILR